MHIERWSRSFFFLSLFFFSDTVNRFLVAAERINAIGVIWGLTPKAVVLSSALFPIRKEVTLILDPENRLFEYAEYVPRLYMCAG